VHKHGLLAGQGLHCVAQLDDLMAVDAAHPGVDVPAAAAAGNAGERRRQPDGQRELEFGAWATAQTVTDWQGHEGDWRGPLCVLMFPLDTLRWLLQQHLALSQLVALWLLRLHQQQHETQNPALVTHLSSISLMWPFSSLRA
jgi:hypothetical protein